ncbi:MAG TPA: hypothetical protein VME21_14825 [Steroidobacteraceae bacterium]|nr:hypothetical protein [Steroidobacteraceae bacterium]
MQLEALIAPPRGAAAALRASLLCVAALCLCVRASQDEAGRRLAAQAASLTGPPPRSALAAGSGYAPLPRLGERPSDASIRLANAVLELYAEPLDLPPDELDGAAGEDGP